MAPENTLAAFKNALQTGVDTLELDIGMTADDVVVISHDAWLNPAFTRDASGQWLAGSRGPLIRSLTFAQLQTYDVGRINPASPYSQQFNEQQAVDGQHIPALSALFDLLKTQKADKVRLNIETKLDPRHPEETASPEDMVRALLRVVREAGMRGRITVQSFDWRTLKLVQTLEPSLPTACLSSQTATRDGLADSRWTAGLQHSDYASTPQLIKAAGCTIWSPNDRSLTQPLVRQAQALGIQALPWTVNAAADMNRLLDWGVDGLITDYPARLRSVMQQRGMPLPSARATLAPPGSE